jgi:hypothetical protein
MHLSHRTCLLSHPIGWGVLILLKIWCNSIVVGATARRFSATSADGLQNARTAPIAGRAEYSALTDPR